MSAGVTEFTLIAEALPGAKIGKMIQGGPFVVENRKRLIETGKPALSAAMFVAMAPVMGLLTPPISRITRWPLNAAAWNLKPVAKQR